MVKKKEFFKNKKTGQRTGVRTNSKRYSELKGGGDWEHLKNYEKNQKTWDERKMDKSAKVSDQYHKDSSGKMTVVKKPMKNTMLPPVELKPKQGIISKGMDYLSAPLSKPKETFTKGWGAGAEAVKQSREKIAGGDYGEAAKVAGTTVLSTGIAAAGILGGEALLTGGLGEAGAYFGRTTAVSTAAIPGKSTIGLTKYSGTAANMVRGKFVTVTSRFATNPKTIAKTTSYLSKLFKTAKNPVFIASALVGAIGTYPFAGFIKEEALQAVGFGVTAATNAGDFEEAQRLIDETNEMLNPNAWQKLIGSIPYANIVKELKDYWKAAASKNEQAQRQLNIKIQEMSGERATQFAQEQQINEEAKRERELEDMKWKAEYYRLIREGKFDEAEELLTQQ